MTIEQREKWDYQLTAPLPGLEQQVSDGQAEAEGDAFMAVAAQHRIVTGKGA